MTVTIKLDSLYCTTNLRWGFFCADGVTNIQDEFGKILGRFDTRISLQSNDA